MIITHDIPWNSCLSKQLYPAIKKGWKDENTPIHFFWGLGGQNVKGIRECVEKKEQWYYVDVGYFTQQITRYPSPKIHDYDKTYFRIVKGGLHTIRGRQGNGARVTELERKGIDVKFKGWNTGDCNHILLCPSSPTVTYHINGITQEEWIQRVTDEIQKHTDMKIVVRQKPSLTPFVLTHLGLGLGLGLGFGLDQHQQRTKQQHQQANAPLVLTHHAVAHVARRRDPGAGASNILKGEVVIPPVDQPRLIVDTNAAGRVVPWWGGLGWFGGGGARFVRPRRPPSSPALFARPLTGFRHSHRCRPGARRW